MHAAISQVSLLDIWVAYTMEHDPAFARFAETVIGRIQSKYREQRESGAA